MAEAAQGKQIKVAGNLILHPRSFTSQKEAAPALMQWAETYLTVLVGSNQSGHATDFIVHSRLPHAEPARTR